MSAGEQNSAMVDRTMESIRGAAAASKVLHDVRRGKAAPEALLTAIRCAGTGERLRGLAGAIQQALAAKA